MEQALERVDPKRRSVVAFPVAVEPWPVIFAWAQRHRFIARQPQTLNLRLFQKGTGLMVAPMRAQFSLQNGVVEVHAWVHNPLLARIFSLFILPPEIHVGSGGLRAILPRRIARKAVNELLAQLGGPQIP
ncbi:MAG TPA: hypothetical protein VFT22_09775 [Kofleriaceae bacterium]|nr:hypothetical protein [Kofleriaceae bacterium]